VSPKNPATTDRLVNMTGELQRRRRARVLSGLWGAVALLLLGQAGVRASLPIWRVDPSVQSVLWNLNGLAHKVVFSSEFLWADATAKVAKIDTRARTITTAEGYHYGGGMSTQQGIQYYAFNLLEEIDAPGEWYLNRSTGMLYLYPPTDPDASTIEIGLFSGPMVTMEGVSHVRLEGLTFDLGRYRGLALQDCTDCAIAGCTVSRMADNGIMVPGLGAVAVAASAEA